MENIRCSFFCRGLKEVPAFSFQGRNEFENKYFTELAHRLQAARITTGHPERNQLTVLLNDQPVLFVSSESDVFLTPCRKQSSEASELYHKVAQTAEEVYAYVEAIQTAPLLHASGLVKFHLLADFGGAVLAGRELGNGWGYQLSHGSGIMTGPG